MKKRLLSLTLALLMVLALLPFGALAADKEDFSAFAEPLQKKLNQSVDPVYGTFFDLDQDGKSEMILTTADSGSGSVYIYPGAPGGIDRALTFGGENDRSDTGLLIVMYPDGAFGLVLHNVVYGEYAGSDDDGYNYYWTDTSDTCYKVISGDLKQAGYLDSHVLQTRPDADGSIRYVPDGMLFSVNGQPASEAQYDSAYESLIAPLEIALVLSPFQQLHGFNEQQLLSLTQIGFVDVPVDMWYAEPVKWAAEQGVTNGTSDYTFSPDNPCLRAQVVTFLWRAAGCPEPKSDENPFSDVAEDAYYYKAVLWAVENEITNGTSDTTFSPQLYCTRGQVATFLYRNAGKPEVTSANPFTDVPDDAYYYDAVLWALEHQVTNGTSPTTFSPEEICTRGHIVTFLFRDLAE